MKILAFDLGAHCGWCRLDTSVREWLWGELDFAPQRHEGGGMRYLRFETKMLENLRGLRRPDMVVYEAIQFVKFQQAAEILNTMTGILMKCCEAEDPPIPYHGVPVGTLKKFGTGKGNANKDMMKKFLFGMLGKPEIIPRGLPSNLTDNEVDAIWLARYAQQRLVPEEELVLQELDF